MDRMQDPEERTPPPSDAPDSQEGGTEDAPPPAKEEDELQGEHLIVRDAPDPAASRALQTPAVTQEVRIGGRQGVRVTQAGPVTVRRAGGGTPDDPQT